MRPVPRVIPYIILVLLLPFIVLWHRDDALFGPRWYADAWFYLGYFRNLVEFKRDLFSGFYYGSRLSWILPGYLFHALLPPVAANAFLHLLVQSTCTLSLFYILRLISGVRSAFLGTLMFSVNPWLWGATGWDYPDGAGIAYTLLALALLTRSARHPSKLTLMLAGAAIAGMAYTHLFLATLTPLVILYYFALVWIGDASGFGRSTMSFCLWAGTGFGVVTLAFCGFNYFLDGTFWFYAPSIARAQSMVKDFQFEQPIWVNGQLAPWLWPAVAGCLTAFALVLTCARTGFARRHVHGLLFSGQLLLAAGYMGFLQLRGSTVLGHHPYASYLLPFVFLVMGVTFWQASETMNSRTYILICSISALTFAILWSGLLEQLAWTTSVAQGVLSASICALVTGFWLRHRTTGTVLSALGFVAFTAASLSQANAFNSGLGLHGNHQEYGRILDARERIERVRHGRVPLFWFNRDDPEFHEYFALNATYIAEFSRISETLPQGCTPGVDPRTLVIVLSRKPAAEAAQAALDECWRPFGTRSLIESVERVPGGKGPYLMSMLHVVGAVPRPAIGELIETLPLERLRLGDPKASLERWPEGLAVTTLRDFGAFAARAPLGLGADRDRNLKLRVRARVLEGKVGFGILDSKSKTFLVEWPMWQLPLMTEITVPIPSEPAMGDLVIRNLTTNKIVSTVIVEKIEVRKIP